MFPFYPPTFISYGSKKMTSELVEEKIYTNSGEIQYTRFLSRRRRRCVVQKTPKG